MGAARDALWRETPPGTRGPRASVTRDQIVGVAVQLADRQGVGGVSMRTVAEDLSLTKMSLYRYVSGKDDLVALMVDAAMGPPPAVPGPWRAALEDWSRALLLRWMAHPWALEVTVGPRPIGPNELAWMDGALEVLARAGVPGGVALDLLVVLAGHVRMIAAQAAARPTDGRRVLDHLGEAVRASGEDFPAVAAALADRTADGAADPFETGLACILDGIGLLVGGSGAPGPAAQSPGIVAEAEH